MRKMRLLFLMAAILFIPGRTFPAEGQEAKESGGLIFYLPFEDSFAPSIAGDPTYRITGKNKDGLKFGEGVRGKCLIGGMNDYRYTFRAAENINRNEGTISMWVKPLNWDGAKEEFLGKHDFFALWGSNRYLVLYKYTGYLQVVIRSAPGKEWSVRGGLAVLKKGKWVHLAVTWKDGVWRLYADGVRQKEIPDIEAPDFSPMTMFVGPCSGQTGGGTPNTAYDELRIYDRRLSEAEIRELMWRDSAEYIPPQITVPLVEKTPVKVDGVLSPGEWRQAAGVTGLIRFGGIYRSGQPRFRLAADSDNFCLAWQIEHGSEPLTQDSIGRDSAVYFDDSIEVFIDPLADGDSSKLVQFIGNPRGTFYDSLGGNKSWDADLKYASIDDNGVWTAELAIPWKELAGVKPSDGRRLRINLCRNAAGGGGFSSITRVRGLYADPERFAWITLSKSPPVAQIKKLGKLQYGRIDLDANILNLAGEKRRVAVRLQLSKEGRTPGLAAAPTVLLEKVLHLAPSASEKVVLSRIVYDESVRELRVSIRDEDGARVLYEAQLPISISTDFEMSYLPSPRRGAFTVTIDPLYSSQFIEPQKVAIDIRPKGAGEPSSLIKTVTVKQGSKREAVFPEAEVPAGRDEIVAALLDASGKRIKEKRISFFKPFRPAEWEVGPRPGTEPGVPPPWTPVTLKKNVVEIWGRTIFFADALLPVAMTSQGRPLLAGPMSLRLKEKGKDVDLRGLPFKVLNRDEESIDIETGSASARASVKVKTHIEFDGVMRLDLVIDPGENKLKVDYLSLVIPLNPQVAAQYAQPGLFKMLPDGRSEFGFAWCPWIGDDRAGLCWFAEGMAGWNLKDAGKAVVVERSEERASFEVKMIDKPTLIDKPLTLTFGLLPTPFKPLPKDYQIRDFQGWNPPYFKKIGWSEKLYSKELYSMVFPNNVFFDPIWYMARRDARPSGDRPPEKVWKKGYEGGWSGLPKNLEEAGHCKVVWSQFTTVGIGSASPYYNYYGADWGTVPTGINWQGGGGYMHVCIRSAWADCLVKGIEIMAEHGIPGQYFDTGAISACRNTAHGCGYTARDGTLKRTLPLFAARSAKKRMRKILYNHFGRNGRPTYISTLCNGNYQFPMLTFDDAVIIGEEWNGRLSATMNDHTRVIDRDRWRVKCGPEKWGFFVLPLFCNLGVGDREEAQRTGELLRLVAGTPVWPGYMDGNFYRRSLEPLVDFGVREGLDFWPWWRSRSLVGRTHDTTEVGIYRKRQELLLVVGSFADAAVEEVLELKLQKLGFSGGAVEAFDQYNKEPIKADGGRLGFSLEGKHFRMITLKMTGQGRSRGDGT